MLRETSVPLALWLAWGLQPAAVLAQQSPVIQVTVLPAAAIEESGARNIKDVFDSEIDVTVRAAPTRFTAAGAATGRASNEGINIRGLEGNQVLMLVDVIRVPNAFSFGSFATGRGDFLNIDSAQAIELLRGPASTQYGSDGLAGVLSLRTLDPADVLKKGQDTGGFARLGYSSVDKSWNTTLAAALRSGAWQGLILASQRQGHEVDNKGSNDARNTTRTTPDPVDHASPSMLGKLIYTLNPAHQFGLTLESHRRTQDTEMFSARALPPLAAASVIDLDTRDRVERERISFEHRYADPRAPWVQKAETRVYRQNADVRQFSAEDRNVSADRTRDNRYRQDVVVRRFCAARGHALVAVLHDIAQALEGFERLWLIREGRLMADQQSGRSAIAALEQLCGIGLRCIEADDGGFAVVTRRRAVPHPVSQGAHHAPPP